MEPVPVPLLQSIPRPRTRTALVASADRSFRQRLTEILTGLRWQVREAEGGAQAWSEAESATPEAIIVDSWLPDLDISEFLADFRGRFPHVDVVSTGGETAQESPRGPFRQELLYALRRSQDTDTAAWNVAPVLNSRVPAQPAPWPVAPALPAGAGVRAGSGAGAGIQAGAGLPGGAGLQGASRGAAGAAAEANADTGISLVAAAEREAAAAETAPVRPGALVLGGASPTANLEPRTVDRLPELIGNAPVMLEVSRRIRLVAARMTPVLIEGPTGSGKELVAEALHRLSLRSKKPFVAINCAAIPEALLEAELFGHTRGAFTGAVQGRVGRIESADGGTLFLDEIGEMPLALQSKLLRFVESSELQRVGDNETVKVDVRIVAATHRPLAEHTLTGTFRADLYYRLAVFLIRTPSLAEHAEDLRLLVDHFLAKMGREEPIKRLDAVAMAKLAGHTWPGNVRELEHVLERAAILAGGEAVLTQHEIDFGLTVH
jgi:DNA-binding NtrC family response regulator